MRKIALLSCLLVLTAVVGDRSVADEALKSGPQVGERVPGPFHPLNINGEQAGKKFCLFCVNGDNPVAMVFARKPSEPLTKLIKKLDTATAANKPADMGSFVVFLDESDSLEPQLKAIANDQDLKHTVLSIDNPAGPKNYNVSQDAEVTVVLYVGRKVKANYAYKAGEFKETDIERIVSDIPKIVTKG